MCTVSMVLDHYTEWWKNVTFNPQPLPGWSTTSLPAPIIPPPAPSIQEFKELKREVENMKALLIKAKLYDERTGQPDCEMEEKMALVRKVAEMVGVSLEDVLRPTKQT